MTDPQAEKTSESKRFWTYENKILIALCFTWGFVMFDRFAMNYMANFIRGDLGMSNTEWGLVLSAFAITWAIGGWLGAFIADLTGKKKRGVLICIACFSIFSGASGLAGSFIMLILIRAVMGLFEGPVMPMAQSFIFAYSTPKRRGFNMGLMQTTSVGVISTLLGPIIIVAICQAIGWQNTFFVTIFPGVVLFLVCLKILKDPRFDKVKADQAADNEASAPKQEKRRLLPSAHELGYVFRNRNVVISICMAPLIMGWYELTLSYTSLYLTTTQGLPATDASFIVSALGIGACIWGVICPGLSDRIGRKPVMNIFTLVALAVPLGLWLVPATNYPLLVVCCVIGWCGAGLFPIYQSAIVSESIPDKKYISTAISTIQASGGIIGVAISSTVAGMLGDAFGLQSVYILIACYMFVAFLLSFLYKETAPLVLARRAEKKEVGAA